MKQLFLIFSIVSLLSSCSSDDSDSTNVSYNLIFQNDLSGKEGDNKSNIVIKNTETWNSLLADPKVNPFVNNFSETQIDFTKHQIIVLYDEMHLYNGYSVNIKKIDENSKTITVHLEYKNTGGLIPVLTRPFTVAKIPKSNKNVVFQ